MQTIQKEAVRWDLYEAEMVEAVPSAKFSLRVAVLVTVALSALVAVVLSLAFVCDPAVDPTCGAAESTLASMQAWIGAHGVPLAIGLFVIGAIVALLIKFGRRGVKAA